MCREHTLRTAAASLALQAYPVAFLLVFAPWANWKGLLARAWPNPTHHNRKLASTVTLCVVLACMRCSRRSACRLGLGAG